MNDREPESGTGRRRALGILLALGLGVAGAGVWHFFLQERGAHDPDQTSVPSGESRSDDRSPTEPSDAAPEGTSTEAVDRALRNEQLFVARTLVDAYPESDDAAYLLGLVFKEQGDSTQAVWWWKRALELDPSRADASNNLGQEALLSEEFAEAERYFLQALQLEPAIPGLRLRLAQALQRQGRGDAAREVLEAEPRLSAEGKRLLGEIAQQAQDFEAAARYFEAALVIKPDFAEAHYGLARTYARLGRADEAAKHTEAFRNLETKDQTVGRHWRQAFDPLAVTVASVAHTHTDVGRVYGALGEPEEAVKLWVRAASLDARNVPCRLALAALRVQQNRVGEALRFYEQIAEIEPEDSLHQLRLGNVRARLRQYDGAETAYRRAIELAPSRPEPYRSLANLFLFQGRNLPEARSLAEEAGRIDPGAESQFTLSQAYDKTGDRRRAIAAIVRALELDPENPEYRRVHDLLTRDR